MSAPLTGDKMGQTPIEAAPTKFLAFKPVITVRLGMNQERLAAKLWNEDGGYLNDVSRTILSPA